MNEDIRVNTELCDHIKVKRLVAECGEEAFRCLIRLWCWAAKNRPTGNLSGIEKNEIEDAAKWTGELGVFYDALCSDKIRLAS